VSSVDPGVLPDSSMYSALSCINLLSVSIDGVCITI